MINDIHSAVNYFIDKCLEGKGEVASSWSGARGPIAYKVTNKMEGLKRRSHYVVFFKRDYLHSFEHLFDMPGSGEGQTANKRILEIAAEWGYMIAVVMPDGRVEVLSADDWLSYAKFYGTIRQPAGEIWEEASVPASRLQSFEDHLAECKLGEALEEKIQRGNTDIRSFFG